MPSTVHSSSTRYLSHADPEPVSIRPGAKRSRETCSPSLHLTRLRLTSEGPRIPEAPPHHLFRRRHHRKHKIPHPREGTPRSETPPPTHGSPPRSNPPASPPARTPVCRPSPTPPSAREKVDPRPPRPASPRTVSSDPPAPYATTGRPHACASSGTIPKSSSAANSSARHRAYSSHSASVESSPSIVTPGPAIRRSLSNSGPVPATRSFRPSSHAGLGSSTPSVCTPPAARHTGSAPRAPPSVPARDRSGGK